MRLTLPKIIWFLVAIAIAWGLNEWRRDAATHGLEAARQGDRGAAERWVDRALRESQCELYEAREYLSSSSTRRWMARKPFVDSVTRRPATSEKSSGWMRVANLR